MRGTRYQITLIASAILVTALFGYFLYVELFPEYRIYQNDYMALEEFRSSYTGEPPPPFSPGIKQIVLLKENKGPPEIDRCTSCHVALQFEHFSPTTLALDANGNLIMEADGIPKKVPNEEYIWKKLDEKIAFLKKQGNLSEAEKYEALKTAHVGDQTYDVTKVLQMHPLIGNETRPFEYHPVDEYGCTSCHGGNGRGLTTEKAHGPVFDGDYEEAFVGEEPLFLEVDENGNDPAFARAYNHKPGHSLLFQTTPILVGGLMEAKCIQCHNTGKSAFYSLSKEAAISTKERLKKTKAVETGYQNAIKALATLYRLNDQLKEQGYSATEQALQKRSKNVKLPEDERKEAEAQAQFLRKNSGNLEIISQEISRMVGDEALVVKLEKTLAGKEDKEALISSFVEENKTNSQASGTLFAQAHALAIENDLIGHLQDVKESFRVATTDPKTLAAAGSLVDMLTLTYQQGEELYLSQACYACHRIAGLARGGIGPELTQEGHKYPWFIKESMVWPQADLKTSTMPNFILDHEELEALMTFLLAQTGNRKTEAEATHKKQLLEWEAGAKMPWEKAVSPANMHNLRYNMTLFATEGCAACHRLKGFEGNAGFAVEKSSPTFDALYKEELWFTKLFPEEINSKALVLAIEENAEEIDKRIVNNVRKNGLLDELEKKNPGSLEAFYANFKYAMRAKNHKSEEEKERWKERVYRLMMVYIQQYGLGRLIGPRPNWSGVYRSDEWLMEHFRNPSSLVARSIMPVFPFDDTKFYGLTYMLNTLGAKNRDAVRLRWKNNGFNPEEAYELFCSQCHGEYMQGNGPVSSWIYPIPKNLRNADFLRHLTREKAQESIIHGVKGTPMPPWGEIPPNKEAGPPVITADEALQLVDWIFSRLPGGNIIRGKEDVLKWQYGPEEIIEELKREGKPLEQKSKLSAAPQGDSFYAAVKPAVSAAPVESVATYFDIVPHPVLGKEEDAYYIKKQFYTPHNLSEGEALFKLNCAVCHGNDADGAGSRASSMDGAKPRMLTNLDWLSTRDDLRLLRSIKYGVPGTSMVAWGDQTTALQRMQLVMYIRSISAEAKLRAQLMEALYNVFNNTVKTIEEVRIKDSPKLNTIENEIRETEKALALLNRQAKISQESSDAAVQTYAKLLNLKQEKNRYEKLDNILEELILAVRKERTQFQDVGQALIKQRNESLSPKNFNALVNSAEGTIHLNGDTLIYSFNQENEKRFETVANELAKEIQNKIKKHAQEKIHLLGKVHSSERTQELNALENKVENLEKLKNRIEEVSAEAERARKRQKELVETYNETREKLKFNSDQGTTVTGDSFDNNDL